MAIYAASLSAGSQIGPVIAGYLIGARGWRWFFILCAIIEAVNLVAAIFMLPETIYEAREDKGSDIADTMEKDTQSHLETISTTAAQVRDCAEIEYGKYFKGLFTVNISKRARDKGLFKYFAYLSVLPFPLLLIPGVLIASITCGAILGGYEPHILIPYIHPVYIWI